MSDTFITLAFAVLFEVLKNKAAIKKVSRALRKLYMTLHANRLLFLEPGDVASLGIGGPSVNSSDQ